MPPVSGASLQMGSCPVLDGSLNASVRYNHSYHTFDVENHIIITKLDHTRMLIPYIRQSNFLWGPVAVVCGAGHCYLINIVNIMISSYQSFLHLLFLHISSGKWEMD